MHAAEERPYRQALNCALRILGRRDHSVAELTHKLRERMHAEDVVQRVIAECLRLNYLDDERAAQQLVARLKRKGWGVHRIRSELLGRGLADGRDEDYLRASFGFDEEQALGRQVAQKKWRSLQAEPDANKRRLRLQRFLRGRGFADSVIVELMQGIDTKS